MDKEKIGKNLFSFYSFPKWSNWIFLLFLFLVILPLSSFPEETRMTKITLAYTSSLNGNIEGCDCREYPRSGLAKSAVLLRELKEKGAILIDGGDFLDPSGDPLLAQYFLKAFKNLKYDFLALGDQEFSDGLDAFWEYTESVDFHCGNLLIKGDKGFRKYSPEYKILKLEGITLGIGAIIDPAVFLLYPDSVKDFVRVISPEEAAIELVNKISEEGVSNLILVFHGTRERAKIIATLVPQVLAIIIAHEQWIIQEKVGEVLLVSSGEEGNRVGILSLIQNKEKGLVIEKNTFQYFSFWDDPDDLVIKDLADQYIQEMKSRIRTAPRKP